jgi:hypothetical protein
MAAANVKCAGGGKSYATVIAEPHKPEFNPSPWADGEPCGWQTWRGGSWWAALPCPRCGGRVELVQPEPSKSP